MADISDASRCRIFLPMALSLTGEGCQTFNKGAGQTASGLALEASPSEPSRVVVPFGTGVL